MPKSPEQFDFSKLEDQKEFDKLSDDKKQELIEGGREEALKIEGDNKKLAERFGEIKIDDELREQISPYIDNKTLTIANGYLAAAVTERSERGKGIGYWDQVRVFFYDQNAMQEWNWRHKDDQHRDQKHLSVKSIGDVKMLKDGDRIIATIELINNDGSRTVDFEFSADNTKPPFEDGEISIATVRPTEAYARKEIDDTLASSFTTNLDKIQGMAKASGIELTENDFRKVAENNLDFGLIKYLEKAQQIAKTCGFELTKDDYKRFMFENLGRYDTNPAEDIKTVATLANFQKEDFQEIADYCINNKIPSYVCYMDDDYGLIIAKKIVEYGNLNKGNFHKIASTYLDREIFGEAFELSQTHDFKFTKDENQRLVKGLLSRAEDYHYSQGALKIAQEAAKESGIEISEDDYREVLNKCIKGMFRYEKAPTSFRNYPEYKLKIIQEVAKIAGINLNEKEESFPQWFMDIQKSELDEADKMYSHKPEMRSATSRTGNKPYEKPEITESAFDETGEGGAFVLKEQIDHDTRFPQMRYTLYLVDKSGNKRDVFEEHDYVDDGGGSSIYVENDPSITELQISDGKLKFKVGGEDHEISI